MEERNEKKAIINKDTLIPIAFVLTIAAGVWFIASLNATVRINDSRLNKVEDAIIKINDVQIQLSAIDVKISALEKSVNKLQP